jgi:hypothetical protein
MEILDESQAAALRGGWFAITVAPSIVIINAFQTTNAFQTNAGASVAVGLLGATAFAGLSQSSLLTLLTSSR